MQHSTLLPAASRIEHTAIWALLPDPVNGQLHARNLSGWTSHGNRVEQHESDRHSPVESCGAQCADCFDDHNQQRSVRDTEASPVFLSSDMLVHSHRGTVNLTGLERTLENVNLVYNNFEGPLPNISRFTALKKFFVGANNFNGTLDAAGNLSMLTNLTDLGLNVLPKISQSSFPIVPTSLVRLFLSRVNMTGATIPQTLTNLARLTDLALELSGLAGTVPPLSSLNLTRLTIHSNNLSGNLSLPTSLAFATFGNCNLSLASPSDRNCFTCPLSLPSNCNCNTRQCSTVSAPVTESTAVGTSTASSTNTTSNAVSSSETTTGAQVDATTPIDTVFSIGAIIGIALAGAAVIVFVIAGLFWWRSKNRAAKVSPPAARPVAIGNYGPIAPQSPYVRGAVPISDVPDTSNYASTVFTPNIYEAPDSPLN
jgi:hypothetical protein